MAAPDFESLAQVGIRGLRAYDPGHDIVALRRRFAATGLLELGSNENPYGPSPSAMAAAVAALSDVHRYPDPLGTALKQALAKSLGLQTAQLFLGNGSHEILMMLAQVFAGASAEIVASEFGFAVYAIAAQAAGARFVQVPALQAADPMPRGHDLQAIRDRVGTHTRLVYLANPNNPTGTWFTTVALERFLSSLPAGVLVVVDEAYIEYADDPHLQSAVGLLPAHPNLVVTRTFSKAYGLAGLRVGYACADPALLRLLERLRESFNVNLPGLAACEAALADAVHLQSVREHNRVERHWLAGQLQGRGLRVAPSQTNFLLVDFDRAAAPVEASLVQRGIVLRPMAGYGLPTCLRVTVGTRADNARLLAGLDEVGA